MNIRNLLLALSIAVTPVASLAEDSPLPAVIVVGPRLRTPSPAVSSTSDAEIAAMRSSTSDTARLLQDVPGLSLYGAGGVSSLPAIHGLADDRLNIKVDGVEVASSCPNHMNSPLSYVDPTGVGGIKVFAGITPVSAGGDSIGGAIIVEAAAPIFAEAGRGNLFKGETGAFYRSNGAAKGANLAATYATETLNVTYAAATAKSDNYKAGGAFKTFTATGNPGHTLAWDEVGSTAYDSRNQTLGLAMKAGAHLVEAKLGYQDIPYELYPNQRMDMLGNTAHRFNLRYRGELDWGSLEARAYYDKVKHYMDFGVDKKYFYGGPLPAILAPGMPMYTEGKTTGASLVGDIALSHRDALKFGTEVQKYRLDDWWPPSPASFAGMTQNGLAGGPPATYGGMAPQTFWNINGGQRDRLGIFAEWQAAWNSQWLSVLGIRTERVTTDTGTVQGYNGTSMYTGSSVGTTAAFNALDRKRTDNNFDLSALARYTPDAGRSMEFGYAQKTRSPNLYERYDWSANGMALEMNNFVGDGNGYLGNPNLKPEVAHTLSFTGDWHDAERGSVLRITPYYTRVSDFIDVVRRPSSVGMMGSDNNATSTNTFVKLQYANQSARLYGVDVSGRFPLGATSVGDLGLTGLLNYTSGKNPDTEGKLYNIMPLNAKLGLTHRLGGWDDGIELVGVQAKSHVSAVRNEQKTPGYSLVNLRCSYSWKTTRVDFGVENLFDRLYALPLGGAYTGQGATMSLNREVGTIGASGGSATLWGIPVPGMGRSLYAGLNLKF